LAAKALDLIRKALARFAVDEAEEGIAHLKPDEVDRQRPAHGFLGNRSLFGEGRFLFLLFRFGLFAVGTRNAVGSITRDSAKNRERKERHAGYNSQREEHGGGKSKRAWVAAELAEERLIGRAAAPDARF